MVVVLICQRNTALRVCLNVHINLSCQRWAGMYSHLATQTWIVDFLLGLAVHSLAHQLYVETGKVAPAL